MKHVTEKELLELNNIEKIRVLKQISKGEIKYINMKEEIIYEKNRV